MKTIRLLLAALLLLTLAACSSDGGDDVATEFDFSGTWRFSYTYVEGSQLGPGGNPLDGTISVSGSQMNLLINNWNHSGTCDPAGGTFTVQFSDEFVTYTYAGTEASGSTMSGEFRTNWINSTNSGRWTWTATLLHR